MASSRVFQCADDRHAGRHFGLPQVGVGHGIAGLSCGWRQVLQQKGRLAGAARKWWWT
jgi:hypothetical protein